MIIETKSNDSKGAYVPRSEWGENGFENRTDSTLTWTDTSPNMTLSIQPVGTYFTYWIDGIRYNSTGDTIQITDVEGVHVVYYDGATITEAVNPSDHDVDVVIRTMAIVSIIYWNATEKEAIYVGEERHGKVMSPSTHAYLHFLNGLVYLRGLGLNTFNTDAGGSVTSAQFGIDSGGVADEDIYDAIGSVTATAGLPIYYMLGSGPRWVKHTEPGFSCMTESKDDTTRLAYNGYTSGSWELTQESNGDFVLYHVFATTEKDQPMISIMGQNGYANRGQAREGAETEIKNLVLNNVLFPEIRPIATIIYQTRLGYANDVNARIVTTDEGDDYVDWRNEVVSRVELSTSDHGNLAGLGNDDHTQYSLLAGRSAGQTLIGGTGSDEDLNLQSTSDATKGSVNFGSGANQMYYSELLGALAIGKDVHQNVVAGNTLTGKFATHVDHGEVTTAGIGCERAENTIAGLGAIMYGGRSRGNLASRTIVQDGDNIMGIYAVGRDGTDFAVAGQINFEVDGTPGANDMPGRIVFLTTPDGAETSVEALRLDSDQKVVIKTALTLPSDTTDTTTGNLKLNTTTGKLQFYYSGEWVNVGGVPKMVYLAKTTQSEGNLNLSDATWGVDKALISMIKIVTDSQDWTATIYPDDDFDEAGTFPSFEIMSAGYETEVIDMMQYPYSDEDSSTEFHIKLTDNDGTDTFDVYVFGVESE